MAAAARLALGIGPRAGSAEDPQATGDPPAGTKAAAAATSPGQQHPPGTKGERAALPRTSVGREMCRVRGSVLGGAGTPLPVAKGSPWLLFSGHSGIPKT